MCSDISTEMWFENEGSMCKRPSAILVASGPPPPPPPPQQQQQQQLPFRLPLPLPPPLLPPLPPPLPPLLLPPLCVCNDWLESMPPLLPVFEMFY